PGSWGDCRPFSGPNRKSPKACRRRSSATSLPTTKAPASSLRSRSATLRCGVCRKSRRRSSTRRTRRSSGSRIMQH
ncbi:unnamed protein product, partial [Effrenium voratum]